MLPVSGGIERNPFALLAGIIEIQHRRDGIDAQSVDVERLDPVSRTRKQEVADFVAAVIENVRAPVGMESLTWIGMLVISRKGRFVGSQVMPAGSKLAPGGMWSRKYDTISPICRRAR